MHSMIYETNFQQQVPHIKTQYSITYHNFLKLPLNFFVNLKYDIKGALRIHIYIQTI